MILICASCGQNNDKKARLEQLKKQQAEIMAEIIKLEKELYPEGNAGSAPVMIDTLKKGPFEHYIEVQGKIDGNENIGVSPRQPGVVTKILVKEGDHVTRGQLLAELDAEVLQRTYEELNTQLVYVTDLYERQKALWDQQIGSEMQYLTAKNNKESLENKIKTLEDQIKMANITSPIDGTVEEIPIKVGQMASAGMTAFRIVNFSRAKAVAEVGEAYTSKIKTGDQVKVFLPDINRELIERVTFCSRYINPVNRTFTVEVQLPSNDTYRANMISVMRIKDYINKNTIAIPQNYIQSYGNEGHYVFIAEEMNGKKVARRRSVIPFITYNGLTEIVSGLEEGDRIITAGYKDLYDGQPISF
jgi:RND family efflux transporter MFP subunit